MTPKNPPTPLPTVTNDVRKRWINAACLGHLTSDELGEKLGIPAEDARAIVDDELRDAIKGVVDSNRDLTP